MVTRRDVLKTAAAGAATILAPHGAFAAASAKVATGEMKWR